MSKFFIGWWGMKFEIFRKKFHIFWSHNGQKTASFSIQTVEFVFK
jgi:hypothetical protein